ncbi:E3 ubiquitin-protein ligase RNF186 [Frankliniella fusca]|uniref:E3 ubiquitin-protein ligase RNF186 n=1 Tax=Frankliniella fusca TaxID=407009 RepID=A0AAE1HPH3_9NEOP|nr:E3 ubiquitin-protein ligase RNF186 [Frankliniella fusca]
MSVNEAILQIIDLYLKNRESKSGLRRVVKSMTRLLPYGHRLPSSNFILNLVESLAPSVTEEIHCFCKVCILYTEAESSDQPCPVCEKVTPQGKFYTFSVRGIVKYLFECRNLASILDSKTVNSDDGLIRDVSDGSVYKTLNMNRSNYDLTIILNSDGVKVKKNSQSELWVLLGSFVEIPLHLRDSFIVVFGLWYDEVQPDNMNTFLKPFAEEMVSINQQPVEWTHPLTSDRHESRVQVQLAVADAPARAKMQNILNFNGKHGCNLCEIKSVKCRHDPAYQKRKRIYQYEHNLFLRTEERMHRQAEQAVQSGKNVKGVKGPSILSIIPSIDISICFIPEYMHSVLLGVVKSLITIWIEKRGPWSIKKSVGNIDCLLMDILHPDFVHRVSRKLDKLSYWKASDFYYFLLFESLPILKEFLPGDYYQHLILLVRSIFQLLRRNISNHDLEEADPCLKLFVNKFSGMYPERDLTYNVHQLLHLSLCVKRHGPLSCNSAFAFEGINGIIAKATHGTYNIGMEIVNNIKICQGATVLKKVTEGLHVHQIPSVFYKLESLGDEKRNIEISQEERDLINGDFKMYSRAKVGYEVFTSLIHKKLKSANFHVKFKLNGEVEYASIKYFFVRNGNLSACLKMYKVDHLNVIYNSEILKTIAHLVPVKDTDKSIIVNGETLASFVKVGKVKNYLFERPNLLHQVM